MLTCLWLSRTIPFPLIAGDRKYSAKLAQAFAATGVAITFVGLNGDAPPAPMDNIKWHIVPGNQRNRIVSLLSAEPLVAARHATKQYRAELRRLLSSGHWDVVVIDQYGMGWARGYLGLPESRTCVLVFVTHDHEESVILQQWRDAKSGLLERAYLLQNYIKTRHGERSTCRTSDLITVNTDMDAALFRRTASGVAIATITPAYDGPRVSHRQISNSTPRAAVMFGSYRWSVKQVNLRLFLDCADGRFHQAGIELRVVGDIPADLRQVLQNRYVSAHFTGFVQDPAPHLDCRVAIVAEKIGGGFKHKLLDYIFRRVPIVALDSCVVGLPETVQRFVLTAPDLASLRDRVEAVIDDVDRLDALQRGAFEAAESTFDWAERGKAMRAAVLAAGQARHRLLRA